MSNGKKGFNWIAFLFNATYYAGKGRFLKGLVMAMIGFIPLTAIPVALHAGFRANKELEGNTFSWFKAIMMFVIHLCITGNAYNIIIQIK